MREEGDRLEVRGFIRRSVVPCRGMSGGSCRISKIDQGKVWAHGMSAICMVGTAREWSSQLLMMVHGGEMKRRITKRQFAIAFRTRLSIRIEGFMSFALVFRQPPYVFGSQSASYQGISNSKRYFKFMVPFQPTEALEYKAKIDT